MPLREDLNRIHEDSKAKGHNCEPFHQRPPLVQGHQCSPLEITTTRCPSINETFSQLNWINLARLALTHIIEKTLPLGSVGVNE